MAWETRKKEMFEKDVMRKLKDDEIMIGENHPMRYAFSILVIIKKFGICKVWVDEKKSFTCRYKNIIRSVSDRWEEVKRFLGYADVKYIEEKIENNYKVIKATW